MNRLGPYRKYIIAAAIIQSIIVVLIGYFLFKSRAASESLDHDIHEKPSLEEPIKDNS